MWVEWTDEVQLFFVHDTSDPTAAWQPWTLPFEKLKRIKRELELQAGSAVDFGKLSSERQTTFAAYIDAMLKGVSSNESKRELFCTAQKFEPALAFQSLPRETAR